MVDPLESHRHPSLELWTCCWWDVAVDNAGELLKPASLCGYQHAHTHTHILVSVDGTPPQADRRLRASKSARIKPAEIASRRFT